MLGTRIDVWGKQTHPVRCNLAFLLLSRPESSAEAATAVKGLLLQVGLQQWERCIYKRLDGG